MSNNPSPIAAISLLNVGKKFRQQWIFKGIDFQINKGDKIAVNGHNGSGKSTLLQIISGYVSASEGKVEWRIDGQLLKDDAIFKHIALASPYMDLIDEYTLQENIEFYTRLKSIQKGVSNDDLLALTGLEKAASRQFRFFSSGMKQKVKLALAFLADSEILLLDEPLSNLDIEGYNWYQKMYMDYGTNKTVVVCSNMVKEEIFFCNRTINIESFKKSVQG